MKNGKEFCSEFGNYDTLCDCEMCEQFNDCYKEKTTEKMRKQLAFEAAIRGIEIEKDLIPALTALGKICENVFNLYLKNYNYIKNYFNGEDKTSKSTNDDNEIQVKFKVLIYECVSRFLNVWSWQIYVDDNDEDIVFDSFNDALNEVEEIIENEDIAPRDIKIIEEYPIKISLSVDNE